MSRRPRVVVVGGGLAGLVAAHRLTSATAEGLEVEVLESDDRVGGKLRTERAEDYVVEAGADGFIPQTGEVESLARELGIEGEITRARPTEVRAYLRTERGLLRLLDARSSPLARPRSLLSSPALSPLARVRVWLEPVVRHRQSEEDESVAAFLIRRLGRGAYTQALEPLLGGVFGADPAEVSAAAALPGLVAVEASGRSLVRNVGRGQKSREAAPPGVSSFAGGMSRIAEVLRDTIGADAVLTGARVRTVLLRDGAWRVGTSDGETRRADGVVLALPAPEAAHVLTEHPSVSAALRLLTGARTAVVNLAYPSAAVPRRLDAHGHLNAKALKTPVSACTWSSAKFDGRAPPDHVLFRGFVRGAAVPEEGPDRDAELVRMVRAELAASLAVRSEPEWTRVHTWSVPVYRVGHPARVDRIRREVAGLPALAVAGAWYDGAGLEAVIRSGERAADDVQEALGRDASPSRDDTTAVTR